MKTTTNYDKILLIAAHKTKIWPLILSHRETSYFISLVLNYRLVRVGELLQDLLQLVVVLVVLLQEHSEVNLSYLTFK